MKLDELLGVRRFKKLDPKQAAQLLATELGGIGDKIEGGSHGVVLFNKDTVFKFWLADSTYEDFIVEAQKHQHNPFFPKFKSRIKTLKMFNKGELVSGYDLSSVKYIKMEVLNKIKSTNSLYVLRNNVSLIKIMQHLADANGARSKEAFYDWTASYLGVDWKNDPILMLEVDQIYEFCMSLSSILIDTNRRLDLHTGNFMMRDDQIVCIDPAFDSDTFALNRLILDLHQLPTSNFVSFKKVFDEYVKKHNLIYYECSASNNECVITNTEYDSRRYLAYEQARQLMIDPEEAYKFVLKTKNKLFAFVEPCIATSALHSYKYAVQVLGDRFALGEPAIHSDPVISAKYQEFLELANDL